MSEEIQCWSCGKQIQSSDNICPFCDMPQGSSKASDDMDFLDDLLEQSSSEQIEEPEIVDEDDEFTIPDMDYVFGKTDETTTAKGELDTPDESIVEPEEEMDFVIPDMDYVSGKTEETSSPKGEFDHPEPDTQESAATTDVSAHVDTTEQGIDSETPVKLSESEKDTLLADMDDLLDEPSSSQIADTEPVEVAIPEASTVVPTDEEVTSGLSITSILWIYGSQLTYWTLIFVIIVFMSFDVTNPNFIPNSIQANDFDISPLGFLASWISFFVMGWFLSYKFKTRNISPKIQYGLIFLALHLLVMELVGQLMIFLYNPSYLGLDYLLTGYFMIIPVQYLITAITAGWFMFLMGYKFLWDRIFRLSPMAELHQV